MLDSFFLFFFELNIDNEHYCESVRCTSADEWCVSVTVRPKYRAGEIRAGNEGKALKSAQRFEGRKWAQISKGAHSGAVGHLRWPSRPNTTRIPDAGGALSGHSLLVFDSGAAGGHGGSRGCWRPTAAAREAPRPSRFTAGFCPTRSRSLDPMAAWHRKELPIS
jgi:hypothetical protein